MALSDADIARIAATPCAVAGSYVHTFARAIEAEVRKSDEALIRQMLEALENSNATLWEEEDDPERPAHAAITAARARLEASR